MQRNLIRSWLPYLHLPICCAGILLQLLSALQSSCCHCPDPDTQNHPALPNPLIFFGGEGGILFVEARGVPGIFVNKAGLQQVRVKKSVLGSSNKKSNASHPLATAGGIRPTFLLTSQTSLCEESHPIHVAIFCCLQNNLMAFMLQT